MKEQERFEIEKEILKKTIPLALGESLVVSLIIGATIGIAGNSFAQANLWSWLKGDSSELVSEKIRVVSEESAVIDVVKESGPGVVSIIASEDVPVIEQYYEEVPFGLFKNFTFTVPRYRQNGTETQQVGAATGFIVSPDGYVLTNKHVVENENADYTVITSDQKQFTAEVVARDSINDIAVLKIVSDTEEEFPFLELGDSDSLQVGQTVIAIGYALGRFDNSVSKGVISGLFRTIDAVSGTGSSQTSEHLEGIIQTDAAINPGNSGGPLITLQGEVVGINVATVIGSSNISFSIPVNTAKELVNRYLQ